MNRKINNILTLLTDEHSNYKLNMWNCTQTKFKWNWRFANQVGS